MMETNRYLEIPSLKSPSLFRMFLTFLRLGATAFGGVSMMAYLRRNIVEKKGWLSEDEFKNGLALCQMIPGATTMLVATYSGLKIRGRIGAVISLVAFSIPAFCLMVFLAALVTHKQDLPILSAIMNGLQAIIVAIIANAMLSFGSGILREWKSLLIAGLAAVMYGFNVNPMLVILAAALAGLVFYRSKGRERPDSLSASTSRQSKRFILVSISLAGVGLALLYGFNRVLFDLAFAMMKVSIFSFGGGFAAVPLMLHEVVSVQGWMDTRTFMDGIVLGQVTPGPVIITATYVGYILRGLLGAGIATISIFFPSFFILVVIVPYFDRLKASPYFSAVINGILSSFVGLLLTLTIRFALDVNWDLMYGLMAAGALIALLRKVDILWVILVGTVLSGLLFYL
jgi:chromate transporter